MITFTLPLPPSINQTYGVNRNADHPMFKRKAVKDWEFVAGWEIKRQNNRQRAAFTERVQVGVTWYVDHDRDIDAGIKVLFDLLQKQLIVKNDRLIRRVTHIDIFEDERNPRVELQIEPYAVS